ncbi:MAG: hypothetical protein H8K10_15515 [Nitrospira sp.]|nr:hypothetical protein [Nitrospira sp.]
MRRIALIGLCLTLAACNTSAKYQVGNTQYETAHMPSALGSTISGTQSCAILERDEKGDCPYRPPMITVQPGLFASIFGPMVQTAGMIVAADMIRDGLAKSGSNYNASSNFRADQAVNIRGHYGRW